MIFSVFCQAIHFAFDNQKKVTKEIPQAHHHFLSELNKLANCNETDEVLNMTRASLLFEGFYRTLNDDIAFKKELIKIRIKRWEHHFGTPTVLFLLSFKTQLNDTKQLFNEFTNQNKALCNVPWQFRLKNGFLIDKDNNTYINPKSISEVTIPQNRESIGSFVKTYNPVGGFTTAPCDPVSRQFIEHAGVLAKTGGNILEIGAGFGAATLEAIKHGVRVFCNDVNPENLAVVWKRFLENAQDQSEYHTSSPDKLVLIPGELPDELHGLPENFFDAVLICRVLHFFTGIKIEESLIMMSKLLTPGGKIYIVCETPYLKNWQEFIPEFEDRVQHGVEWPGEVTRCADYESSGRAASLPKFIHLITKEVIDRTLLRTGFNIEHSAYINRTGQFPNDLLLPEYGRESVGAIGVK